MAVNTKTEIRNRIKEIRNAIPRHERVSKSRIITNKVINLKEFEKCQNLLVFISAYSEVYTEEIIRHALILGKHVFCPKVYGETMEFIEIHSLGELAKGSYNIPEPISNEISDIEDGLIIMPGMVFDYNLHRIGYGGGYYDKYLSTHKNLFKVAIAYDEQVLDKIPSEEFDEKPNVLVTDKNIYKER